MAKMAKSKWLSALALLLALLFIAGCGGTDDTDGTTGDVSESLTDEVTEAAATTEAVVESSTEADTEPESTEAPTSLPTAPLHPPQDTTTEPSTASTTSTTSTTVTTTVLLTAPDKLPQTKAEILAAYTKVVDKVKIDMPAYSNNDWQTMSNVDMNRATYGIINPIAKQFLETKDESTPGEQGAGNHPKWFAMPTDTLKKGCILTDTSKIESASCTKSGEYYIIKITLIPEKDPVSYMKDSSTKSWHGQLFDVIDITQVVDYARKVGFNAENAYCTFHGTATLKYNPVTNECYSLDHQIDVRIFLGAGAAKVIADYTFYNFRW